MEVKCIVNLLRKAEGYISFNAEHANEIADALEEFERKKENLIDYNAYLNNRLDKAESYIEKLEKQLSEKQEWISVEERLPKSEFVLCTDGKYCFVNIIPDMEDVLEDGVTHWMPLPEPPNMPQKDWKRLIDKDALESKICWACSDEFPDAMCAPSECRILEAIRNVPFVEMDDEGGKK